MSIRRLRARLDRLTRSMNATIEKKGPRPFEFTIDAALAKSIADDDRSLRIVEFTANGSFFTRPREPEEERVIRARIAEKAKTITCPPHYGFRERWDDDCRIWLLGRNGFEENWDPFVPDVTVYDVENVEAERDQLTARIAAFDHSPEGQARLRMEELLSRARWLKPEEYAEVDRLIALYPEPWCHPEDPHHKRWMMDRYQTPEERKKEEEEAEARRRRRSQGGN